MMGVLKTRRYLYTQRARYARNAGEHQTRSGRGPRGGNRGRFVAPTKDVDLKTGSLTHNE